MNWTDIIVATISFLGACVGTIYGIQKANNLTIYRIEQLEKKVDIHNGVQERVLVIEEQIKGLRANNDKLNDRVAAHGEQIDNVYTLAEKNENRISLLERVVTK